MEGTYSGSLAGSLGGKLLPWGFACGQGKGKVRIRLVLKKSLLDDSDDDDDEPPVDLRAVCCEPCQIETRRKEGGERTLVRAI